MRNRTMMTTAAAIGLAALLVGVAIPITAEPTWFNGVSSWAPANEYDAPIFRQFAFVEGVITQYHVLTPEAFKTDNRPSRIYQFPECATLSPVLEKLPSIPGHPLEDTDSPTRRIVDVVLSTGCAVQPESQADVLDLALVVHETPFWVNAPRIPDQLADLPDDRLFNGPPFRPRVAAWQDGAQVQFITYETNWHAPWVGTNFPSQDSEVYIVSYGSVFRDGYSILNVASGTPMHESFRSYSPMWAAFCIVDADNPKCMISVNRNDPSYYQCESVAECMNMENSNGKRVELVSPNLFTHIDCPMVAVDLDGDRYIDVTEELVFPDLWVNGPVLPGQVI